LIDFSCF